MHATNYVRGVEVELHSFLTSALHVVEWLASHPVTLRSRKEHPLRNTWEADWAQEPCRYSNPKSSSL